MAAAICQYRRHSHVESSHRQAINSRLDEACSRQQMCFGGMLQFSSGIALKGIDSNELPENVQAQSCAWLLLPICHRRLCLPVHAAPCAATST